MQYVRLCSGVRDKGILIPEFEVLSHTNSESDFYQSVYYYNENHYEQFQKTGSIKGIRDVFTNKLVFDFDYKEDPNLAKLDAIQVTNRLLGAGIKYEDIHCYFSGNKGFNIIVEFDKVMSPEEVGELALKYASDLKTFDTSLYDASQILRVPGTKHQTSGLYKIPLTLDQLYSLPVQDIAVKASSLDNVTEEFNWGISSPDPSFFEVPRKAPQKNPTTHSHTLDLSNKPANWRNCKYSLLQGHFKPGERHEALIRLAATCRGLGYDKEATYYLCKSALKKQAVIYDQEEFPKDELWLNIIEESVFADGWEGGQYSCQKDAWLKKYCESLGEHRCKEPEVEKGCKSLKDMAEEFLDYASNFEKNVIKTNIPGLDDHVMFCASTLTGILGQPGCHAKGTEILMYDGTIKKVEDIVVGDLLMGPDSQPREVLKLQRGRDKMVKIIPNQGEDFVINQHHILNLKPSIGTNNKAFECNLNIMFKDYVEKTTKVVKHRYKIHRTGVSFPKKQLTVPPYILGAWLGDGHSKSSILTNMDEEIIKEWCNYGKTLGLTTTVGQQTNRTKTYHLNNGRGQPNVLLNNLKELKVLNNKHVPHHYLTSSTEDQLELLAGLLDTDGHLDSNHTGFQFISKLKTLSDSVVFLSRSLGLHASIVKTKKGCWYNGNYREGTYYQVQISGDTNIIPTRVKRKQARPRKMNKDPLVTGFTYEMLGEDDYYGFTLDKDHLYLTADFFVHHNSGKTSFALNYLENASKQNINSMFLSLDMGSPIVFAKLVQKMNGCDFKSALNLWRNDPKTRTELYSYLEDDYKNVAWNFTSGLTVSDMRQLLKNEESNGKKVKLLVIDYLECIAGPYSDATANSGFICNQLKDLANEMQVCIVLLLQTQKHSTSEIADPLLSLKQVKGSSLIEQSMSTILTLWREGYSPNTVEDDRYISFAVVKNRFGSLWRGDFGWHGQTGSIHSLTEEGRELLKDFRERKAIMKMEQEKEWQ